MTEIASCCVRVPATTANLGPGFDCFGLALDLWNEVRFTLGGSGVCVSAEGAGTERLPTDERNLIATAFLRLYRAVGATPPADLRIHSTVRVPLSSGLGSSSTAIVAGLMGANELLGRPLDRTGILELAVEIEGHPDNVAAAIWGGLTIVVQKGEAVLTKRIEVPKLHVALAVPRLEFSTNAARAQLPTEVSMADAVFNLGRAPLVMEALRTGDYELLGDVMDDRLHQAARLKLIPGGQDAWRAAEEAGAAAVAISGSGPSLVAFVANAADAPRISGAMVEVFRSAGLTALPLNLDASPAGATVSS